MTFKTPSAKQLKSARIIKQIGWHWTFERATLDKLYLYNRVEFDNGSYFQCLIAEIDRSGRVKMGPDTLH